MEGRARVVTLGARGRRFAACVGLIVLAFALNVTASPDGDAPGALAALQVVGAAVVVFGAWWVVRFRRDALRRWVSVALDLRGVLVAVSLPVVALCAPPGPLAGQMSELIRSWEWNDRPELALGALCGAALASAAVWASGARVLAGLAARPAEPPAGSRELGSTRRYVRCAVAGLLVCAVGFAMSETAPGVAIIRMVGLVLAAVGVLMAVPWVRRSAVAPTRRQHRYAERAAHDGVSSVHASALGAMCVAPWWSVAFAVVRRTEVSASRPVLGWLWLALVVAGALAVGLRVRTVGRAAPPSWLRSAAAGVTALMVVWSVSPWWVHGWRAAPLVGTVGWVMVAASAGALVLGFATSGRSPSPLWRALGFCRTPVLSALVLWLVVIGVVDPSPTLHSVRLGPVARSVSRGRDLGTLAGRWAAALGTGDFSETVDGPKRVVPVVFVAATGGGARAAAFTLAAWRCYVSGVSKAPGCGSVVDAGRIFAASGVSGGALGLAGALSGSVTPTAMTSSGFVDQVAAHLLFVDTPAAFVHAAVFDRADRLESAWDEAMPAMGDSLSRRQAPNGVPAFPLFVANAATVEGGCRFDESVVVSAPANTAGCGDAGSAATVSLNDWNCDAQGRHHDVALSSIVMMSARYAYISPTGGLRACAPRSAGERWLHVIDGGYIDNTATSAIADMIDELFVPGGAFGATASVCFEPVVLHLDGGSPVPVTRVGSVRPAEILAPIEALQAASDRADSLARQRIQRTVSKGRCAGLPSGVSTYVRLAPPPGNDSPLGWQLSARTLRETEKSVSSHSNQCAIAMLQRSLHPQPRSERGGSSGPVACTR